MLCLPHLARHFAWTVAWYSLYAYQDDSIINYLHCLSDCVRVPLLPLTRKRNIRVCPKVKAMEVCCLAYHENKSFIGGS